MGWVQTGGAGFLMDNLQFAAGAQDHAAGQGEATSRQHTLIPLCSPLQTLGTCIRSHRFKFWHALRHTMSDANSKPENIGDSVKSARQVLTRKTLYANLRLHSMKNETKQRIQAALLAALIAALIITLGLIEQALLPINH